MPRPQLVLSPLIAGRPAPPCDPAAYAPAASQSYRVVPLTALNQPAPRLPLRRRRPPVGTSAPTGPLFPPSAVGRTRADGAGLAAWFNGASHARGATTAGGGRPS
ncbi:hypothetical protein ACIA8O_00660 [Kitasatospora sp. NPDC051853]|uniref:hypothetical protein n=1 Tax=Kitasatospora sp. NPDC051853 TaxID=3364058 RepID=UPI00379369D6